VEPWILVQPRLQALLICPFDFARSALANISHSVFRLERIGPSFIIASVQSRPAYHAIHAAFKSDRSVTCGLNSNEGGLKEAPGETLLRSRQIQIAKCSRRSIQREGSSSCLSTAVSNVHDCLWPGSAPILIPAPFSVALLMVRLHQCHAIPGATE
jgi:hypothetical protein